MPEITYARAPAVSKAVDFIRKVLTSTYHEPGERLPSLAELAHQAAVSRSSMWKALTYAKSRQLLTITRGGFITAGNASDGNNTVQIIRLIAATSNKKVWQKKKSLLERDILNGRFNEYGHLPPGKELRALYGFCPATLRKILNTLVESGAIIPYKRLYHIASVTAGKKFRNTIVLLSESFSKKNIFIRNQRLQKLVDTLEYLCADSGMKVKFVDIAVNDAAMNLKVHSAIKDDNAIAGCILDIPWVFTPDDRRRVVSLVNLLTSSGKPIAIFDSIWNFSPPRNIDKLKNVQLFRIAAYKAGAQVGSKLIAMGHRRIAYFSLLHETEWSVLRLAGLRERFKSAGHENGVISFVKGSLETHFDEQFWFGKLPADKVRKIVAVGSEAMVTEHRKPPDDLPEMKEYNDTRIRSLQNSLANFGELVDKDIDPRIFVSMREAALAIAGTQGDAVLSEPLFEKALLDKSITAWVGANDGTAVDALAYLAHRNLRVPHDISVVGFDNRPDSFELGLTTYDFNISGILHRMIWFIRSPNAYPSKDRLPEEVEGAVIERNTLGKVKK